MSPSPVRYFRLPLDISVSPHLPHHLYLLHLHLQPNSKRGSAPNSSVRFAYWHANRLCLYLAEKEQKSIERRRQNKLKTNQPRSPVCPILNTNNCHLDDPPLCIARYSILKVSFLCTNFTVGLKAEKTPDSPPPPQVIKVHFMYHVHNFWSIVNLFYAAVCAKYIIPHGMLVFRKKCKWRRKM